MVENKVVNVHLKRYLDSKKNSGDRALDYMWEITGDDIDASYVDGSLKVIGVLNAAIGLYNKRGWGVISVEGGRWYWAGPINGDKIYPYQLLLENHEEKDTRTQKDNSRVLESGTDEFQL